MSNRTAMTVEEVTKRFRSDRPPALVGVSAVIRYGQITGLVGPDGAGKTTLLRLMAGLLPPDQGRILLEGRDVRDPAVRQELGYMPQKFGLYEELTVLENLHLYADLRGLSGRPRQATIGRLLEFSGLGPFGDRLAGRLSGGMKQKLGLACALLGNPKVLLLDEPTVGVDPVSRRGLWQMVEGLAAEGLAVVWATAYLDEAERCAEVLALQEGQLLFAGPPGELTGRMAGKTFLVSVPGDRRRALAAQLLQRPEVADATVQGNRIRVVLREAMDEGPATSREVGEGPAVWEDQSVAPTPPRFEDALILLLGGSAKERASGAFSFFPQRIAQVDYEGPWAVEAAGLTKKFGSFTAVDRVSFHVSRGEIFGLLGPNGAGKSTTFKMLCGLLPPTAGKAQVAGVDIRRAAAKARNAMGYMAQKFSLYGNLSVRQNLEFFGGVYGLRRRKLKEMAAHMAEEFQLGPFMETNAEELPLGFQQRLAMACALMHQPPVLFLDEPTSGVDPLTRREFWMRIHALAQRGSTVIVTTHFMDEAEYCDRLALMHQGRIIAEGAPDQIKASAATPSRPAPSLEDAFVELLEREAKELVEPAAR
ncbi:MAG TPA: ATP-binding cassette domain-containing protein [Thermoguttaceae bacterium]|nr:ATP-binding cassette domain-containing protein [Thermoguttaceae bacterium]